MFQNKQEMIDFIYENIREQAERDYSGAPWYSSLDANTVNIDGEIDLVNLVDALVREINLQIE
jgi:hypothetical protein